MKITGTDALMKELNKLATLDDIKNAVKINTATLQTKAQRKAPVDTGNLKRSIALDFLDGGFTGRVATNVEYAPIQEFGSRFQTGTPFLRPSLKETELLFRNDLQRLMK